LDQSSPSESLNNQEKLTPMFAIYIAAIISPVSGSIFEKMPELNYETTAVSADE